MQSRLKDTYLSPFHIARKSILNAISQNAKYAHGILLDIGCGNKPYLRTFSGRVQTYIGLDLPSSNSQSVDIFAEALFLPFTSDSLDTVLSTEVIEHIPEPADFLGEIGRVLKKGGILILSAPLVWAPHSEPHDYFRFTQYGLKYLMNKTGFRILFMRQTCGFWATYGQRLSDFLFQKYSAKRGGKALVVPLCLLIQVCSTILDKASNHEGETLDYIVIASKK